MTLSVNTNMSALAVLQALNATTQQLDASEGRVSSGLNVAAAADNPAVYAAAQSQRAEISTLSSVSDGLNRAQSISDVAVSAGQTISDLLNQMKSTVLSATTPGQDSATMGQYNSSFHALLAEVQSTLASASFDGANLLNGSTSNGLSFMATADASSYFTLSSENLSLGGPLITFSAGAEFATSSAAASVLTAVDAAITGVNAAVATIGAQSGQIAAHSSFVATLTDTLTTGVGSLVDADMAAESARLTALQVQQQLGVQTLSLANQQPSIILTLLRGG
jgi:flagellin